MDEHELHNHLSRLATHWSVVRQAHQGGPDTVAAAQAALVERYQPAIYRYLLAALRNADAADEVAQEFALRLVRGDFRRADPERGRFRDYVKTALYHLIADYQKRKHGRALPLTDPSAVADTGPGTFASDREFLDRWRDELLRRTWDGLKEIEQQTGTPYYAVLHFRSGNASLASVEMTKQLSARLNKRLTDAGVRQTLHRAREKFAALLVAEVGRSLQTDDAERIEQELTDLGLLAYCRSAVERRRPK
jgi:RNA polymerase sigma-70 factor (ECF subfamily)